jgi:hypothetical protein
MADNTDYRAVAVVALAIASLALLAAFHAAIGAMTQAAAAHALHTENRVLRNRVLHLLFLAEMEKPAPMRERASDASDRM